MAWSDSGRQVPSATALPGTTKGCTATNQSGCGRLRSRCSAKKTPSDDPQRLRDRADLLRDSADKLLRKMAKLKSDSKHCSPGSGSNQRCPQRWTNLFAEQTMARRGGGVFGGRKRKPSIPLQHRPLVVRQPADDAPDPGSVSGPTASLRTRLIRQRWMHFCAVMAVVMPGAQASSLQRAEGGAAWSNSSSAVRPAEQRAVTLRNQK